MAGEEAEKWPGVTVLWRLAVEGAAGGCEPVSVSYFVSLSPLCTPGCGRADGAASQDSLPPAQAGGTLTHILLRSLQQAEKRRKQA